MQASPKSTSIAKSFFTVGKTRTSGWYARASLRTPKKGPAGGFNYAGPFESRSAAACFAVLANNFAGTEVSDCKLVASASEIEKDSLNAYGAPTNAYIALDKWSETGGITQDTIEIILAAVMEEIGSLGGLETSPSPEPPKTEIVDLGANLELSDPVEAVMVEAKDEDDSRPAYKGEWPRPWTADYAPNAALMIPENDGVNDLEAQYS